MLRAAERLATAIVSVDRRSFPLDSAKVRPIGHGIDVNEFSCADRDSRTGLRAIVLGRYSPAKGIDTILRAVRQTEGVEVELHGAALNTLEESALMADRLAARSHEHQHGHAATRFERRAEDARQQARIIRQVLTEGTTEAV